MPIIDAHPHIYSPDRKTYPTIDEPWEPGEPAAAEDLKRMMDAVGVDRAVFIQTGTFYGFDNRYVMDSAKAHSDWACGVITLEPDNFGHVELLEKAVAENNIRGLRGIPDSINRISSPRVYRLWSKAMELGIPVNCMVMDDLERVPEIFQVAQDLEQLKIVIDHCFMLNTRQKTEETLQALERLAQLPNVYAKLTCGTHGSYRVYPFPDMQGPIKRVIEAFGAERCVWGSNFPNALWSKGASYAQNLRLFVKELGLGLPEKSAILGGTAMALWFPQELAEERRAEQERARKAERAAAGSEVYEAEDSEMERRQSEVIDISTFISEKTSAPISTSRARRPGNAGERALPDAMDLIEAAEQLNSLLAGAEPESRTADPGNQSRKSRNAQRSKTVEPPAQPGMAPGEDAPFGDLKPDLSALLRAAGQLKPQHDEDDDPEREDETGNRAG
jgi:predicted TIM-barrel fold metal-dependent hydrolase